jgi:hypothetical protein
MRLNGRASRTSSSLWTLTMRAVVLVWCALVAVRADHGLANTGMADANALVNARPGDGRR